MIASSYFIKLFHNSVLVVLVKMINYLRTLPLVLLVTQLSSGALFKSTEKCTDPDLELLDTEWYIYINLPEIDVYSCRKVHHSQTKSYLKYVYTEYYDVTRNCLDLVYNQSLEQIPLKQLDSDWKYDPNITEAELHLKREQVQPSVEVSKSKHKARIDLQKNLLYLPSNTACTFTTGFCYDPQANGVGYVWDRTLRPLEPPSCGDLFRLNIPLKKIMKFTLQKEYLIFEGEIGKENLAVEMTREVSICNSKAWTNNAGLIVTNATFKTLPGSERLAKEFVHLQDKQTLYQSLVEQCQSEGDFPDIYCYAVLFLLAYVTVQFLCSTYNLAIDCATFRRVEGGSWKWLFQSWINKLVVSKSIVAETKLKSEIEMNRFTQEEMRPPSYYAFRRPT